LWKTCKIWNARHYEMTSGESKWFVPLDARMSTGCSRANSSHFLLFVQQYPATLDCLCFSDEAHFHLDGFVNKQNTRFWASENPHRAVETSIRPGNEPCGVQPASKDLLDLKDGVYRNNPRTVQVDKFVVHRLFSESTRLEDFILNMCSHEYRIHTNSPRKCFRSCIMCFCTLKNYEYTRHWNCCVFYEYPVRAYDLYIDFIVWMNTTDLYLQPRLTYVERDELHHGRQLGIPMCSKSILLNKTINRSCSFLTHFIKITQPVYCIYWHIHVNYYVKNLALKLSIELTAHMLGNLRRLPYYFVCKIAG
jgi:hypothetical protein